MVKIPFRWFEVKRFQRRHGEHRELNRLIPLTPLRTFRLCVIYRTFYTLTKGTGFPPTTAGTTTCHARMFISHQQLVARDEAKWNPEKRNPAIRYAPCRLYRCALFIFLAEAQRRGVRSTGNKDGLFTSLLPPHSSLLTLPPSPTKAFPQRWLWLHHRRYTGMRHLFSDHGFSVHVTALPEYVHRTHQ